MRSSFLAWSIRPFCFYLNQIWLLSGLPHVFSFIYKVCTSCLDAEIAAALTHVFGRTWNASLSVTSTLKGQDELWGWYLQFQSHTTTCLVLVSDSFPKCALDETNFKEMMLWKLIVIAVHLSKIRSNKKILDQFCDGNRKQNKTNKQIDLCIEKTWK